MKTMKRNEQGIIEYTFETLMWMLVAFVWYRFLLYSPIPGMKYSVSNAVFTVIICIFPIFNYLVTNFWHRNSLSVTASAVVPYGIYSFLSERQDYAKIYWTIFILTVSTIVVYILLAIKAQIGYSVSKRGVMVNLKKCYIFSVFVLIIASALLILPLFAERLFKSHDKNFFYGEKYLLKNNIETIALLDDGIWRYLSKEEKLDVLQCVCYIEGNYLGLNKEVRIQAAELEENVASYYIDAESAIYISLVGLEDNNSEITLRSVCHEMFHAAQYRYVEIYASLDEKDKKCYFFSNAALYEYEFVNYQHGNNGDAFYAYYSQKCEEDARAYAENAISKYYAQISEYLATGK